MPREVYTSLQGEESRPRVPREAQKSLHGAEGRPGMPREVNMSLHEGEGRVRELRKAPQKPPSSKLCRTGQDQGTEAPAKIPGKSRGLAAVMMC